MDEESVFDDLVMVKLNWATLNLNPRIQTLNVKKLLRKKKAIS